MIKEEFLQSKLLQDIFAVNRKNQELVDAEYKKYLAMSTGQVDDLHGLSRKNQESLVDFLLTQKNKYINFLNKSKNSKPIIYNENSKEYENNKEHLDVMQQLNKIKQSFVALKTNLTSYKNHKIDYDNSVLNNAISKGVDVNDRKQLNDIFGGKSDLNIDDKGMLHFKTKTAGGKKDKKTPSRSLGNLPNWFNKSTSFEKEILDMSYNASKQGSLTNSIIHAYKQSLSRIIKDRPTLLSAATDDILIDGGLGLSKATHPDLFKLENESALKEKVIEDYIGVLNNFTKPIGKPQEKLFDTPSTTSTPTQSAPIEIKRIRKEKEPYYKKIGKRIGSPRSKK